LSIRLNKLLARRGIGARRKCDALIQSGVVRVNDQVVSEPGTQVEPERDRILVRGRPLPAVAELSYYALHKPVGVITTLEDPEGRRTVRELMPPGPRMFPVGRLDADTSGLLVLTNDGDLAHRLMHPRYGVAKTYRVRVERAPDAGQLARLRAGVEFEPGVGSNPAEVRVADPTPGRAIVTLTLHEGRYRQVRRMFEAVGLAVVSLHRSAYGPLRLGELPRGMWRELSEAEVSRLRAASARPTRRPAHYFGVPRRIRGFAKGPGPGPVRAPARGARARGEPPRGLPGEPPRRAPGKPVRRGRGEPWRQVPAEPARRRRAEPARRGRSEAWRQVPGEPARRRRSEPARRGRGEAWRQVPGEPARRRRSEPARLGRGEAWRQVPAEPARRRRGEPWRQMSGEPARRGRGAASRRERPRSARAPRMGETTRRGAPGQVNSRSRRPARPREGRRRR